MVWENSTNWMRFGRYGCQFRSWNASLNVSTNQTRYKTCITNTIPMSKSVSYFTSCLVLELTLRSSTEDGNFFGVASLLLSATAAPRNNKSSVFRMANPQLLFVAVARDYRVGRWEDWNFLLYPFNSMWYPLSVVAGVATWYVATYLNHRNNTSKS